MKTKTIQAKRAINFIAVHCSDSDISYHDNIETIKDWHLKRGFNDVGYHAFIDKKGVIHQGRPDEVVGAHIKGYNKNSLAVCLSGRKSFTKDQFKSLELWCREKCLKYGLQKSDILSHCDLDVNKTCPNFNLQELVASWDWH